MPRVEPDATRREWFRTQPDVAPQLRLASLAFGFVEPWTVGWLGALLLLVLGGCAAPPTECCLVDSSAQVVVEGVVSEANSGSPIAGAEVHPTDVLGFECRSDVHAITSIPASAESSPDGTFSFTLISGDGPGRHCVDFVVQAPAGPPDTLQDIQLDFSHVSVPADTVIVELVVQR